MPLTSKIRNEGDVMLAEIPAEIARQLVARDGEVLYWYESAPGVYSVSTIEPDQLRALAAHEYMLERYREVFAALAK